jgi:type 1 glutamine amidotransferase
MKFTTKFRFVVLVPLLVLGGNFLAAEAQTRPKILCFTKTQGYDHGTRQVVDSLIMALGAKNGFDVDTANDTGSYFKDAKLKTYKAVCFINVTGTIFNDSTKAAFTRYFRAGGGYVGMHAAVDCEYTWHWYHQMAGAYFAGHPFGIASAKIAILNRNNPSTIFLKADTITRSDEWYFFANQTYDTLLDPAKEKDITVLMSLVESTLPNSTQNKFHPLCWTHEFEGGRAWYSAFGHSPDYFRDTIVQKNLLGGIVWAAGIGATIVPLYKPAAIPALTPFMAIAVYNALGQKVRTLYEGQKKDLDIRKAWDNRDDAGRLVPVGHYFVKIRHGLATSLVPVIVREPLF